MPICFVMQPFDGGPFDRRYREVFEPAIRDAQLDPYRVDQDPKSSIPIEDIERGIRQSQICLAEITLDNPNVWFELGYAIACGKEVVLICADSRTTKFPFDVQHRSIIKYSTESPSSFESLRGKITEKLRAYIEKSEALESVTEISELSAQNDGFSDHEIVALAAIAQNIEHDGDHAAMSQIQRDMEAAGFTRVAAAFAVKSLVNKKHLVPLRKESIDGEVYYGYAFSESGWRWVLANQDRFALKQQKRRAARTRPSLADMDDDIPF